MISFLSALIVMVAIGTVIQRADVFTLGGGSGPIRLVDDRFEVPAQELTRLDIFANDEGLTESARESLIVLEKPGCGRILHRRELLQYYAGDECAGEQKLIYTLGEMDVPTSATVIAVVSRHGRSPVPPRPPKGEPVANAGAPDQKAKGVTPPASVASVKSDEPAPESPTRPTDVEGQNDAALETASIKEPFEGKDGLAPATVADTGGPGGDDEGLDLDEPRIARLDPAAMAPKGSEADKEAIAGDSRTAAPSSAAPDDLEGNAASEASGQAERPQIDLPKQQAHGEGKPLAVPRAGADTALLDPAKTDDQPLLPGGRRSGQELGKGGAAPGSPPVPQARSTPGRAAETRLPDPTIVERATEQAARTLPTAVAPSPAIAAIEPAANPGGATDPVTARLEPDPIGNGLVRAEPRLASRSETSGELPSVMEPAHSATGGPSPAPLDFQKPDITVLPPAEGAARPGARVPAEMSRPIDARDVATASATLVGPAGAPVVHTGAIPGDGRLAALDLEPGGRPVVADLYAKGSEPDPVDRGAVPDEIARLALPSGKTEPELGGARISLLPATSRVAALVENRAALSRTFQTTPPQVVRGNAERRVGSERPAGAVSPELHDDGIAPVEPDERIAAITPSRPLENAGQLDVQPALDRSPVDTREAPLEPEEKEAALPAATDACTAPPATELELRNGARTMVRVMAPCHVNEVAELSYSGLRFAIPLNAKGEGRVLALGFQPNEEAEIRFPDNTKLRLDLPFRGIDKIDRIAIVWDMPIAMELHALEFGAEIGDPNHVSPANPRSFRDVRRTGGGFLREYQTYRGVGQNAQIYTYWHRRGAQSGVVSLRVDYSSRSRERRKEACGSGKYASPDYMVLRSAAGRLDRSTMGRLAALDCAGVPAADSGTRLISGAVKDLVVEN